MITPVQRSQRMRVPMCLLVLLWAFIILTGAAETEVILDNAFRRGFILWESKPGKHVKY